MKYLNSLLFIFIVLTLQACSAKQFHSLIQDHQKQECQSLPTNSQYEECIKRNNESYDEYSRKREEVIEDKADS